MTKTSRYDVIISRANDDVVVGTGRYDAAQREVVDCDAILSDDREECESIYADMASDIEDEIEDDPDAEQWAGTSRGYDWSVQRRGHGG